MDPAHKGRASTMPTRRISDQEKESVYRGVSLLKDFTTKVEIQSRNKKGKRECLNDVKTRDFMDQLNAFFESFVKIPRIMVGERQTIETLIDEEASFFQVFKE